MERRNEGAYIRKGPWTAEEDEVLINHVKRNGPRDWSSIRSKGLLPRTGKSCRLRWVNKLQPNLKTGCKFSSEEEKMVVQLQAQFGNKWAKIATYLQGRTDNDVKNFWSSRRKRLERTSQAKSTSLNSQKNKGKSPLVHYEVPEVPFNNECFNFFSNLEESRMVLLPDLVNENMVNVEAEQPKLDANPCNVMLSDDSAPQYFMSQLPQPPLDPLDLPFLSECKELDQEPIVPNFLDTFRQEFPECESDQKFFKENTESSKLGDIKDLSTPNILFEEFSPEMLDYLETLTSSSEL